MSAPSELSRLRGLRPALEVRARVLQAIRGWFAARGFLEVVTPVRIPTPALELHIDAEPSGAAYLRTSPEFHMKRLLAAGYEAVFQVGPCFRRGERGDRHHPEYTMLEWYRARSGAREILADTAGLVQAAAEAALGRRTLVFRGRTIELAAPWPELTVREAFGRFAGWDPVAEYDEDRFNADLVEKVEPAFPADRPLVLTEYPAAAAAMARLKPDDPRVAERWELYVGGLELANAFGELTDAAEQRRRMEQWAEQRRAAGRETYPLDEPFLAALEAGLPPSGGAALGVDRLVMLLADAPTLDDVLPFRDG